MGTNLRPFIKTDIVKKDKLRKARVAIDGTNYLIKYLSVIRKNNEILFGESGEPISHLFGFGYLILNLYEAKIKPIVVLDGIPDEKKRLINRKMQQKLLFFWKLYETKNQDLRRKLYKNKYFLYDKIKGDLRKFLAMMGVPCIFAPSEAEAQASYMVLKKQADIVFSEDYDCLLYGAKRVVKEFKSTETTIKLIRLPELLSRLEITRSQLIDLALMIGTDIFPGINGIGPKKGLKLIKKFGTFENVLNEMGLLIPENIEELKSYYSRPPRINHPPLFGHPNFPVLHDFLKDKMDHKRKDKFIRRMRKAVNGRKTVQKTLLLF